MSLSIKDYYDKIYNCLENSNSPSKFGQESYKLKISNLISQAPESYQKRLHDEFFNNGPLEQLINNHEITEIIVNNYDSIYYEKHGSLVKYQENFFNEKSYNNFIHHLCLIAKLKIDYNQPYIDGVWNGFRLHLIQKPLTVDCIKLTLRRKNIKALNFDFLVEQSWADIKAIELIKQMVQTKKNILIIGSTNVGKTTIINTLLARLEKHERIISIEDTDELIMPNNNCIKLLTRNTSENSLRNFDQSDLIKQCLRMRPDRIVLGEVRGAEAKDLILATSTGHKGCMSSLHADNARQALLRLEVLIQMGSPNWSLHTIRRLILLGLDIVITLKNSNKKRYLEAIHEVSGLENNGLLLQKLI